MITLSYKECKRRFQEIIGKVTKANVKFKINADFVIFNCLIASECYRELMVSFFPMLPLIEKQVDFYEADYIIYAHPFARVEDMSPGVIKQLKQIDVERKPGAEIIVVGKATNIEPLLEGTIQNITFYESHFTEILGKRFEMNIKDEYFVYDTDRKVLNIWPVNGCMKKCKFCRRCYMNIPFESLTLESIKNEMDYLKENDPSVLKVVDLRAENITEYGFDLGKNPRLPDLVNLVSSYDEVKKILSSIGMAPCGITDEILDCLCECNKIVQINMNPEVGSNKLFKLTGKNITRERTIYIFKRITKAHPAIVIVSTVMIGFPGETLMDIYELAKLIQEIDVDSILVNFVRIQPRSPLANLLQLSEELKEYHLKLLIHLLKQQERNRELVIEYPKIHKKGTRSRERLNREAQESWNEYSVLCCPTKTIILKPTV